MRRRAFTLIELLVVIAIMSLLVGTLFPSLSKARDYAKLVMCRTNLKGIGLGWKMYNDEYPGALPSAASLPGVADQVPRTIMECMSAQVPEPKIWQCPNDDVQYFEQYGTSYEYYCGLALPDPSTSGKQAYTEMEKTIWTILEEEPSRWPIVGDAEGFHPTAADPMARQCMMHDGSVNYVAEDFDSYDSIEG
jgi:prepilin-type N-terminal cleavage/methylation domain-containing protein